MDFTDPGPEGSSLAAASHWLEQSLQGGLATAVATIAVAILGYQMLAGRFSAKAALRVGLGCFILFGSSVIARGLMSGLQDSRVLVRDTEYSYQPVPAGPTKPVTIPRMTPSPGSGNPFDPYASNADQQ